MKPASAGLAALGAYLPEDRLAELRGGPKVAPRAKGSVLFADISGFTQLTSRLAHALGPRRGAEEVPYHLNRVYDALIGHVRSCGGSVVGFAGDAITCWFPDDGGRRAVAAALNMQATMPAFSNVAVTDSSGFLTFTGETVSLSLKVSVAAGYVSRFVVGDPAVQLIDVVAGRTVEKLDFLNGLAETGEVAVGRNVYESVKDEFELTPRLSPDDTADGDAAAGAGAEGAQAAARAWVVRRRPPPAGAVPDGGILTVDNIPETVVPDDVDSPPEEALTPWLLRDVKQRLDGGLGDFLTELKPVAALFMRFTGIDYDHDPQAKDKLDALARWAQSEVDRLGGAIVQLTVGDKGSYLYATFGAPVAHEDDAVRCAAAALSLRAAAHAHPYLTGVHVGIGLGVARTGAYGAAGRRTYGALGDETNMAARMMSRADNGTVLASQAMRRATAFEFEYLAQPPLQLKGKSEPQTPFLLLRRRNESAPTTFDEAVELPFVARERDTARIVARIEAGAAGGDAEGGGGVVAVVGESGMGKSRLVARALARAAAAGLAPAGLEVHAGECQSFERNTPYAVWRPVFRGLLGLEQVRRDDPAGLAARELEQLVAALSELDEQLPLRAPLLSPVIGLAVPDNDLTASLTTEQQGAARESLLLELLRRCSRRSRTGGRALVLLLEDVHWQDSASAALLGGLARVVADLPLSVLLTLRPDGADASSAVLDIADVERIDLEPLPVEDATFLAQNALYQLDLDDTARRNLCVQVVERAEGNPLYLAEILNDLVAGAASGVSGEAEAVLPSSLHSLLLGRIDQLPAEPRTTLKVASVVGRTFDAQWLPACRPQRPPTLLAEDVSATRRVGLTSQVSGDSGLHAFRHALTADVAYESLSYAQRAELHTRLARFLETALPDGDARRLALLAHHFDRSLDADKRREYLLAAGRFAQSVFANEDAASYYRRLLPLVAGSERVEVLQLAGEVAVFMGAYGEAQEHYLEALALAEELAEVAAVARSQRLLGELAERQGDHHGARDWLERARSSCDACGDERELAKVLLALGGNVLWQLGEYEVARAKLDRAAELADQLGDRRLYARAIHGLGNLDLYQGNSDSAKEHFQRTLTTRRELGDELGVANSLNNLAIIAANLGDYAEAEAAFNDSLAIRRRIGDTAGVAVALNNLGYMAETSGDLSAANDLYSQSLTVRRDLGDKLGIAVSLNNLAALARREGDIHRARSLHRESLALAHAIGNVRETVNNLVGLAATAAVSEDLAAGATLLAGAEAALERLGAAMDPDLKKTAAEAMENFTNGLEAAILSAARNSGKQMDLDEVVALALDTSTSA